MTEKPLLLVVDDDPAVRDSLRALLESAGYAVEDYESPTAFLRNLDPAGNCAIIDIRMPDMDGLELQAEMARSGIDLPVIIMTGHGDVALAVRAMKAGAVDFIEKPFSDETLLESIRRALRIGHQNRARRAEVSAARNLIASLTPRERHVLDRLIAGRSNKATASELGISPRTIEIHRAHIMDKMNARSLSDLVRIALVAHQSPVSDA